MVKDEVEKIQLVVYYSSWFGDSLNACRMSAYELNDEWLKVRKDPDKAGSHAYRGTYGWSGAFGTHMFVSPEQRLAVTFMMNRENIGGADSYIIDELEALICE